MAKIMACRGKTDAIPATTAQVASALAATATTGAAARNAGSPANPATTALPATNAAHIGASARSLPATMVQRGTGRDHRYAPVRSSISSPIDGATNIGGKITSTS